jgi:hypothetical protein
LLLAGEHIKDVSGIKTKNWHLMKLATAVKIICYPAEATEAEKAVKSSLNDFKCFTFLGHLVFM